MFNFFKFSCGFQIAYNFMHNTNTKFGKYSSSAHKPYIQFMSNSFSKNIIIIFTYQKYRYSINRQNAWCLNKIIFGDISYMAIAFF